MIEYKIHVYFKTYVFMAVDSTSQLKMSQLILTNN